MEVSRLMTLVQVAGDDDPLAALTATARLRVELERVEAVHVRRARTRGLTWEQVAGALGVSRQAVHKKHGGAGRLRRTTGR